MVCVINGRYTKGRRLRGTIMEKRTISPTRRQKLAIEEIAKGSSISRAMRIAGYDETTAKNPKNLTESKAFNRVLGANGLTESLVVKSLVSDIKSKPRHRVPELNLGADILGLKKKPDNYNDNRVVNIIISDDKTRRMENRKNPQ